MTIECYYSLCPHHSNNETPPDEGPFCFQSDCIADKDKIPLYEAHRVLQLANKSILPSWWCTLNVFEWPEALLPFKDKVSAIEIMMMISSMTTHKACLKEWNKEHMSEEEFENWWKRCFEENGF